MAAPRIKIFFENGALGQIAASADGVFGLLCTGAAVTGTFDLGKAYVLRSLDSLTTLGVTALNNAGLYKLVADFYAEAGTGTELWLMAFPDTVKMSEMVDHTDVAKGRALVNAANGRLRALIVSRTPDTGYTPTITNGLDSDVAAAQAKAELLAKWCEDAKSAPLFVLLEGYGYSGNPVDLADQTTGASEHTAIMIGNTEASATGATKVPAAIGLLAGRLAKYPIQVNPAKVANGPVAALTAYLANKAIESADWESVHDKGYITLRTYPGRSGYFFTDDPTCTLPTDDYCHITAVRTIQKAFRIAYNSLLEKLVSEVPVLENGTIQPALAKSWEADVENAIAAGMTAFGELSNDPANPADKGVKCYIDPVQNVVASSRVEATLRVRPYAYARYIDVKLGFQVVS